MVDAATAIALDWVPGSGPVLLETLGAGLVNRSYRVVRDGAVYVLRIAGSGAPVSGRRPPDEVAGNRSLGLDPRWEARVLALAAASGFAPAVLHHDVADGILVTRWAVGRPWDAQQAQAAVNLRRMASLLRQIHALAVSPPHRTMSPAAWMQLYEEALQAHAESACTRSRPLRPAALDWRRRAARADPVPQVLCHSDLHLHNVLDTGQSLLLLDWEYAHMSEPFWDTAAWISNNDLDGEATHGFLGAYLGRAPSPVQATHQRSLCWAFDYVCLLWSELYLQLRVNEPLVESRAACLAARLATPPWS